MKKIVFALSALVLLAACDSDGYKIRGSFTSAKEGTVVYMAQPDEQYTVVDSAVINNGKFEFTGARCNRTVRMLFVPDKAVGGPVVLEPGVVDVEFGATLKRGGTDGNTILQRFMEAKEHLQALEEVTSPNFLKTMPMDKAVYDSLVVVRNNSRDALAEYAFLAIERNIGNNLGMFILTRSYSFIDAERVEPLLQLVPEFLRDVRYNLVRNYISLRAKCNRQRSTTAVGKQYLNFELSNIGGEKVLFSSVLEGSRYTLLQFWASWCASCRVELPAFNKLEKKYGKKGFTFVGVSLDSSNEDWRKAVASMGLGGVQLCNPSGGSGEVAAEYGVDAVPANILINNKGVIIARDLSPAELDAIVGEASK